MQVNELFSRIRDYMTVYLPSNRNASPNTIRSYRHVLTDILRFVAARGGKRLPDLTFADLTDRMLTDYLDTLESERECSVSTRNLRLNGIRSFVSYCASMDVTKMELANSFRRIKPKKPVDADVVKFLSESAMKTILACPDPGRRQGRRDRAMLCLLYDSAARVQELANVRVRDLVLCGKPQVLLRGKGRKARTVPLMPNTAKLLHDYLAEFLPDHDMMPESHVFQTTRKGVSGRMTEDNIRHLVGKYGKMARAKDPGVPVGIHPHMFRHSRAMHLYEGGLDLTLVSQWLGHAQFETTLIYAHADTEHKRRAAEAATGPENPLQKHVKTGRMKVSDEELIRRLCGLQ